MRKVARFPFHTVGRSGSGGITVKEYYSKVIKTKSNEKGKDYSIPFRQKTVEN
jgi:hypothetical protein